jgi:hypothetical protein
MRNGHSGRIFYYVSVSVKSFLLNDLLLHLIRRKKIEGYML